MMKMMMMDLIEASCLSTEYWGGSTKKRGKAIVDLCITFLIFFFFFIIQTIVDLCIIFLTFLFRQENSGPVYYFLDFLIQTRQ